MSGKKKKKKNSSFIFLCFFLRYLQLKKFLNFFKNIFETQKQTGKEQTGNPYLFIFTFQKYF